MPTCREKQLNVPSVGVEFVQVREWDVCAVQILKIHFTMIMKGRCLNHSLMHEILSEVVMDAVIHLVVECLVRTMPRISTKTCSRSMMKKMCTADTQQARSKVVHSWESWSIGREEYPRRH